MASDDLTKLYSRIESAVIKDYEDFRFIPSFSNDVERLKVLIFSRWRSIWELQGEKVFSKLQTLELSRLTDAKLKQRLHQLLTEIGFA